MARRPRKPWWWAARGCWAVWWRRKRRVLAYGRKGKAEAEAALIRLLASGDEPGGAGPAEVPHREPPPRPVKGDGPTINDLARAYVARPAGELAEETRRVQARYLGRLRATFGPRPAASLTTKDVSTWLVGQASWGAATRAGVAGAIKSVFGWAVREGYLSANPLAALRVPGGPPRQVRLTAEQFAAVLETTPDAAFRDYLFVLLQTGARPGELVAATAADYRPDLRALVLAQHKTARKTGRPRIIYLTSEAQAVVERRIAAWPEGPIFRNAQGGPWIRRTVSQKVADLRDELGLPKGGGVYGARHLLATQLLVRDVAPAKVAALLGHASTRQLFQNYSHLSEDADAMHGALEAIRPAPPPEPEPGA